MRGLSLLLLLSAALLAQITDLPPDVLFIANSSRHIRQSITALPNYTCLETIDRERLKPPARAFQRLDRVRLEVAKVGGKELFSWPGAVKFEERSIGEFVGGGLISDGIYSLFADSLFINRAASVKVFGPELFHGRPAIRLDYTVGSLNSNFVVTTATGTANINYSGSYWVDPLTMDLLRIDIHGDDIPMTLRLRTLLMSIDYRTMKFGDRGVALAQTSAIEMTALSGEVSRDQIDFTHCREYAGESRLIMDDSEVLENHAAPPPLARRVSVPANLSIPLRLVTPIDLATSGIGDDLTAIVESDVKDRQQTWLPKGSIVHGRLRRLERRQGASDYVLVGIEFSEVKVGRDTAEFTSQLLSIESAAGLTAEYKHTKSSTVVTYKDGVGHGGSVETKVIQSFDTELPGVGYLYLTSAPFKVPANLRMIWKTQAMK